MATQAVDRAGICAGTNADGTAEQLIDLLTNYRNINRHYFDAGNPDKTKRLFYVMIARAREQVVMLKRARIHCPVEAILPQDNEIMERK